MNLIRKDIVIVALVSVTIGFALIACILKLIDQSDAHVKEITATKVETSATNVWKPQLNDCDLQLEREINADPLRVIAIYRNLEFSEAGFKHFAKLKRLQSLKLIDCTVQDDWIKYLKELPLTELSLSGSDISAAAGKELSKITTLKALDLSRCDFDDVGLEPLTLLEQLEGLNLNQTKITDRASAYFPKFKNLEELRIGETAITKGSFAAVSNLTSLKSLDVNGTKCDTKTISCLRRCKQLMRLRLTRCDISDDVFRELANFPALEILNVENNQITDLSLTYVKRMPSLKQLMLAGCPRLSVKAIQRLQHDLPKCQITYGVGTNVYGF